MCREEFNEKWSYYLPLELWFIVPIMYSQFGKYIHEAAAPHNYIYLSTPMLCNGELSLHLNL